MYLNSFHQLDNQTITISPQQASRFAKEVAQDFNPLHDPESKRFCVPGDLLFALVLANQGLSQKMVFNYTGMVGEGVSLDVPNDTSSEFKVTDNNGKEYLNVSREGDITKDMALIEAFTRAYVAFSGHSFPHILVPLMKDNNVMINPARPMVIYESMSFQFNRLDLSNPTLELVDSNLKVDGKRGTVSLKFHVMENGEEVGTGMKSMVLSGLRDYDEDKVQALVELYETTKANYQAS